MKSNKTQLVLIVAAAFSSLAQAQTKTISISSKFTVLEQLSALDRVVIQKRVETEHPLQKFDWEKNIIGINEDGKIEVRDKESLRLEAVSQPSCYGGQ